MKITFICAVFPPEPAPAGVMARQLASRLAQDGHDLTMIVPIPNRPEGVLYPGYSRKLRSRSSRDGYTVVHCANWLVGRARRTLDRLLENITFGLSSMWAAWREGRPDVIILETWPIFATSFGTLLARCWRVPYIHYVQDVYPEAAVEAGILDGKGFLVRACRALDRSICAHSAKVIVISETMRELLTANRALARERFAVIPNWIDESAFTVRERENAWRALHGIEEHMFVALFAGTLGHASGVEILLEVARLLQSERGILILCIGEGVHKLSMIDEAARLGLANLRFLPFQPRELVPDSQASCDVALLTTRQHSSDSSVPSKLITYLATARPVICTANEDSAVARTVIDTKAGLVVSPGSAEGIADAILRLKGDPALLRQMSLNARQCFEDRFTLARAYRQIEAVLKDMALAPETPHSQDRAVAINR